MSVESSVKKTRDGAVLTLALNRPSCYNAFDRETITLLWHELRDASCDTSVRAVILTGEGKGFCSGADLRAVLTTDPDRPGNFFYRTASVFHQCIIEIRSMPKPVIAAVNGVAAGGGFGLALACDLRVAAASAVFKQSFTSNGLSVDGATSFTLPRLVGLARSLEIAMLDEAMSAMRAYELGLVTKIVPDTQLRLEALALAERVARMPVEALGRAKRLFNQSFANPLEAQLELERHNMFEAGNSAEAREGITAFLEKRKPVFTK